MRQLKITQSITTRSDESLDKYLTEISRIPMVSTEEEVQLAQAIHAGGPQGEKAKERLITANLRFVVSVAVDNNKIQYFTLYRRKMCKISHFSTIECEFISKRDYLSRFH